MALLPEEMEVQKKVLTENTADNTSMKYSAIKSRNTGVNPKYYANAADSRIVNLLNSIFADLENIQSQSEMAVNKVNGSVGDIDSSEIKANWDKLLAAAAGITGADNLVTIINAIVEGKLNDKIFDLKDIDEGKILSIAMDQENNIVVKPVDMPAGGGGTPSASQVTYTTEGKPEITNVAQALDMLFATGGGGEVDWSGIQNKPDIPNKLTITEESLCIQQDDKIISSVPLMNESDVNGIVAGLDSPVL